MKLFSDICTGTSTPSTQRLRPNLFFVPDLFISTSCEEILGLPRSWQSASVGWSGGREATTGIPDMGSWTMMLIGFFKVHYVVVKLLVEASTCNRSPRSLLHYSLTALRCSEVVHLP